MRSLFRLYWAQGVLPSVIGLYLLLAIGLLAPMASDSVLPVALDDANHTAAIVQAKMALDEGQFPLKVAPFQHDGLRYPLFQFYSSTPYLIGSLIYKYLTPWNPWLALKLVYFLGLWIAGFFVFRVGRLLGFDESISALMGVAYVTAPYILINIHARGAYTEAFAQFIIPILSYTSLQLVRQPTRFRFAWTSVAWLLLGTSHVITFVYGTAFYLVLAVSLYVFRRTDVRTALALVAACGLGWCLSAFQWYPAATVHPLQIQNQLGNMFETAWLTPISSLLAPTSVPPEPLGRDILPFLNFSIGVTFVIAIAGLMYFRHWLGPDANTVWSLMLVFFLAFICVWSPVDFWSVLPVQLRIAQFPYRFLTYTTTIGTALFGYFAQVYRRRFGGPLFLGWLIALVLLANPYLPSLPRNTRSLSSIIKAPDIGYGAGAYLYIWESRTTIEDYKNKYERRLPLVATDNWLLVNLAMPLDRDYIEKSGAALTLVGDASPLAGACRNLELTLDDVVIASREIVPGPVEWQVPNAAFRQFRNKIGKLAFKSKCGFVPADSSPGTPDNRLLWIRVGSLKFQASGAATSAGGPMTVEDSRSHCRVIDFKVDCEVDTPTAVAVQLPVFYYPSLLRVTVNGLNSPYKPSSDGDYVLALVSLTPGRNHIVATFAGSRIGNTLSLFGMVVVLISICFTPKP